MAKVNVRVGSYYPPNYGAVPGMMDNWLLDYEELGPWEAHRRLEHVPSLRARPSLRGWQRSHWEASTLVAPTQKGRRTNADQGCRSDGVLPEAGEMSTQDAGVAGNESRPGTRVSSEDGGG